MISSKFSNPLTLWWRQHTFFRNTSSHLNPRSFREYVEREIRRIFRENAREGRIFDPDPALPLLIRPRDVEQGRLETILRLLSGFRYRNDLTFSDGLERTLIARHQKAGRRFQWKRLPPPTPVHVEFINNIVGFGAFADRTLVRGEFVGEYAGVVRQKTEVPDGTYGYTYPALIDGSEDIPLSIDARDMGNITRFINHSPDEPIHHDYEFFNGHWHVMFHVERTIHRGEQLFIDYGSGYWEGKPAPPLELSPVLSQLNPDQSH